MARRQKKREGGHGYFLGALCALMLLALPATPWHTANNVDDRTTLEMIRGISERGLPAVFNAPEVPGGADMPELAGMWLVPGRDGLLWGKYPPLYAYLMAPIYMIGAVPAVLASGLCFMVLCVLATAALGRRLSGDPRAGLLGAFIVATSGLAWIRVPYASPYPLMLLLISTMMLCAVRAGDEGEGRALGWAALAGLAGGVAAGCHLLAAPALLGVGLALLIAGPGRWRAAAACAAGAGLPLLLVALVNHRRFGAWNPLSYGPCVWRSCAERGVGSETMASLLPMGGALAWLLAMTGALALGVWAWRRQGKRAAIVAAVALVAGGVALAALPALRGRELSFLEVLWIYAVDPGAVTPRPPVFALDDGLGVRFAGWLVKSGLQGTPVLALALLARGESVAEHRRLLVVALPAACGLVPVLLRAGLPAQSLLGSSPVVLRYLVPLLPALAVLSAAALRRLPWQRAHLEAGGLFFLAFGALLLRGGPMDYPNRLLLLRGTLVCAAVAFLGVAFFCLRPSPRSGAVAAFCAALALVGGAAVGTCADIPVIYRWRHGNEAHLAAVAEELPERAGLVGSSDFNLHVVLSLRAQPGLDMEYADMFEAHGCGDLRRILAAWGAAGRPIYLVTPEIRASTTPCLPPGTHWGPQGMTARLLY